MPNSRIVLVTSTGIPPARVEELRASTVSAEIIAAVDSRESICAVVPGAHALIGCPRPCFDASVLKAAGPSLRWIHVPGAGCEEFLIPELVESDIILTNGRIIQGPEVADHALALLLALSRNLHLILRSQVGHTERPPDGLMPRPIELRGKVAVVFGCGGVGMGIAERLHACGMEVLAVDEQYVPMVRAIRQWYASDHLLEALALAGVVIVSAPVTARTRARFDRAAFAAMRPGTYFVNVARGVIVDTDALVDALRRGAIRAAALDVTDPEPLPDDHPLRGMPNVIITPHIAGPSDQNRERSARLIEQNIARFIAGHPLLNVVNKRLGY